MVMKSSRFRDESHSLKTKASLKSDVTAAIPSVLLVRRQQNIWLIKSNCMLAVLLSDTLLLACYSDGMTLPGC